MDSSVHHSDSPSINSSPSATNPLNIPCNYGEKAVVNYLHENLIKSPTIHTLYIMPFSAPVHASSVQSVHTSCIMSVIAPFCASSIQPIHSSCDMSVIAPVHASSIQPICTSCIMSIFAPTCASPIPSVHPYDDE